MCCNYGNFRIRRWCDCCTLVKRRIPSSWTFSCKHNSAVYKQRTFDLKSPLNTDLLDDVDILIHCAVELQDSKDVGTSANIRGTKALLEIARKKGLRKIIYISTTSAHPKALSTYGKHKFLLEQCFCGPNEVVLKPGLVIGHKGLGYNLIQFALKKSIIPLVGGGVQPLQIISIEAFLEAISTILNTEICGTFVLANLESISYRKFFTTITEVAGKKARFVNIPFPLMTVIARIGEVFRLKLPFSQENLLGLRGMVALPPEESLAKLQICPPSLRVTIERLLRSERSKLPSEEAHI